VSNVILLNIVAPFYTTFSISVMCFLSYHCIPWCVLFPFTPNFAVVCFICFRAKFFHGVLRRIKAAAKIPSSFLEVFSLRYPIHPDAFRFLVKNILANAIKFFHQCHNNHLAAKMLR
jgi:hypothetical protein